MHRLASFVLLALCVSATSASTVRVAISGTTTAVSVDEGPIFGYNSYAHIPDGTPFVLVYLFDDHRGSEKILQTSNAVIMESAIETASSTAPGTNAILQIGDAQWEFGVSSASSAKLSTAPANRSYEFTFGTPARGNRVSASIKPTKEGFWPVNADWRASFMATSLVHTAIDFSADNNRVSAKGKLIPLTLTVSGVDLGEQWLTFTRKSPGTASEIRKKQWHLAHPSPTGGYIVQEVIGFLLGEKSGSNATSTTVKYWEAWEVRPQAKDVTEEVDRIEPAARNSSEKFHLVSTSARFYEGLSLPAAFRPGGSAYAGSRLSSTSDPHLETGQATLPITTEAGPKD